jgi:hypothetical protein
MLGELRRVRAPCANPVSRAVRRETPDPPDESRRLPAAALAELLSPWSATRPGGRRSVPGSRSSPLPSTSSARARSLPAGTDATSDGFAPTRDCLAEPTLKRPTKPRHRPFVEVGEAFRNVAGTKRFGGRNLADISQAEGDEKRIARRKPRSDAGRIADAVAQAPPTRDVRLPSASSTKTIVHLSGDL